ncbi:MULTISPECIES: hypothetical protein [unclassified Chelatococcus]|uniref:AtuA-related protein n=1 Tax=unclassified Chelatococcus TaxID=2638111 RepID=UPI001BCD0269|nr:MULTISPECIES: hypothetical protein [unclassified Chelatococcus]MBS7700671.1 hypothetical protein [Chelatococcus sp. YT9]MBX3559102.1 hypothetical protein [Chelatococcus sp.]
MRLRQLAHARSGDKGDISQISVIAFDEAAFDVIRAEITVDAVRAHFGPIARGKIERFELPHLGILNFVLHEALSSGVTRSLALDPHGKCLGSLLLDLSIASRSPAKRAEVLGQAGSE